MPNVLTPAPTFLAPGPESILDPIGVEVGIVYTIVGPDGTRAVLNDRADRDFVGFLSGEDGVTGLERAGVRESSDTLPEADGGVHGAFRYDRLSFTLKGLVVPDATSGGSWLTRQAKLLRATNAMRADALLLWTPSEAPPVQVSFRQQQPTRLTGRRPKAFLVTGVSERNVVEAQALSLVTIVPGAIVSGGMGSPLGSPLGSAASDAGSATVIGGGQSEAWPVITFTGPIVNPSIESQTLGLALHLNYTLAAGERLVLDSDPRRRTVRLNDQSNRYSALDYLASSWFPLVPGANELAVGASSYSIGSSVAVAWRDAWG